MLPLHGAWVGSIPGRGTKIPQATWIGQNKQTKLSIRDPKEDIQMTNTWKDAQHYWSLEKCIKTKMKLWLCIYRMAIRWTVARLARIWRIRSPTHGWWEYKVMQPFWKTFWHILKMLNSVAIWPSNLPLCYIWESWKHTSTQKHVH